MISKHCGGELVTTGTYWNLKTGEFVLVSEEAGYLAGGPEVTYLRVPLPLILLIGPVLGLLYVIFLPLAAPVFLLRLGARRVQRAWARARQAKAPRRQEQRDLGRPLGGGK